MKVKRHVVAGKKEEDGRHFFLIPLAFLRPATILYHPTSCICLPEEFLKVGIKPPPPTENSSCVILTKFYGVSGLKGSMICAT